MRIASIRQGLDILTGGSKILFSQLQESGRNGTIRFKGFWFEGFPRVDHKKVASLSKIRRASQTSTTRSSCNNANK